MTEITSETENSLLASYLLAQRQYGKVREAALGIRIHSADLDDAMNRLDSAMKILRRNVYELLGKDLP